MKTSERIAMLVNEYTDAERHDEVSRLAGKVALMEAVLEEVEFLCNGQCDCDLDEGVHCLWCRAKAALE